MPILWAQTVIIESDVHHRVRLLQLQLCIRQADAKFWTLIFVIKSHCWQVLSTSINFYAPKKGASCNKLQVFFQMTLRQMMALWQLSLPRWSQNTLLASVSSHLATITDYHLAWLENWWKDADTICGMYIILKVIWHGLRQIISISLFSSLSAVPCWEETRETHCSTLICPHDKFHTY